MVKIKKEKSFIKDLDEAQKKASARLATVEMLKEYCKSLVSAFELLEIDIDTKGEFCLDSSKFLGDCKPFRAGRNSGLKIYPSSTKIYFKFLNKKEIEIVKLKRI